MTRWVSLLHNRNKKEHCFKLVTKLHVSLQLLWRHFTYRHTGCSEMPQSQSEFLAAHVSQKGLYIFLALNAVISFLQYRALFECYPSRPPSFLAGQYFKVLIRFSAFGNSANLKITNNKSVVRVCLLCNSVSLNVLRKSGREEEEVPTYLP